VREMDLVLSFCDEYMLDAAYAQTVPLPRDNDLRICLSLFVITCVGGYALYLSCAALSYYLIFDHDQMKHPRFLKNQIRLELECALSAIPGFTFFTIPWFWGSVKGYSRLYENVSDYGLVYWFFSIGLFLFFTDMCIYWIHRWLHIPWIYKRFHKPHHKWIVPTPFASHAFHPLDGYSQSVPYHLFIYLFPLHKYLYLGLFVAINIWTIMIHDGAYMIRSRVINDAAHHSVHHLYFNYNYGQYFTVWDRLGGSHREPTDEQYDAQQRRDRSVWKKQAAETDKIAAVAERENIKRG